MSFAVSNSLWRLSFCYCMQPFLVGNIINSNYPSPPLQLSSMAYIFIFIQIIVAQPPCKLLPSATKTNAKRALLSSALSARLHIARCLFAIEFIQNSVCVRVCAFDTFYALRDLQIQTFFKYEIALCS